jgi:hypothetical protein
MGEDLLPEAPDGLRLVGGIVRSSGLLALGSSQVGGDRGLMHVKRDVCDLLADGRLLRVRF